MAKSIWISDNERSLLLDALLQERLRLMDSIPERRQSERYNETRYRVTIKRQVDKRVARIDTFIDKLK